MAEPPKLSTEDDVGSNVGSDDDMVNSDTSLMGSPYHRSTQGQQRSEQSRQRREEAGERLLRMAANIVRDADTLDSHDGDAFRHPEVTAGVEPQEEAGGAIGSSRAAVPSLGGANSGVVFIFDWDDTLFPTWFTQEVVNPCLPDDAGKNPVGSAFHEALQEHGKRIVEILRTARSLGRVGIVTLAQRPWVQSSAKRYIPGLDFGKVLEELEIPIVYARECVKRAMISKAEVEEGVNVFTIAKQAAMLKALKKLYGKNDWVNIISIGDSIIERDAIKELLWSREQDAAPARCKTVKLMEEPSVEQLGAELLLLGRWLHHMAHHGEDFDLHMDDTEESMLRMHQSFCS